MVGLKIDFYCKPCICYRKVPLEILDVFYVVCISSKFREIIFDAHHLPFFSGMSVLFKKRHCRKPGYLQWSQRCSKILLDDLIRWSGRSKGKYRCHTVEAKHFKPVFPFWSLSSYIKHFKRNIFNFKVVHMDASGTHWDAESHDAMQSGSSGLSIRKKIFVQLPAVEITLVIVILDTYLSIMPSYQKVIVNEIKQSQTSTLLKFPVTSWVTGCQILTSFLH